MPEAPFSPFANRLSERAGPVYGLHVGDTWLEPFDGARMEELRTAEHPGLHRYGPTRGHPALLDALIEKLHTRNGLACDPDSLLVSAGATHGISCVLGALLDPGEEVLILAPHWPLIRGIVQAQRGRPVEVPFYDRVASARDATAVVQKHLTSRSVALYVSTPSNPTGRVIPESWLIALADLARRCDLWLLSDEVYEDYVYDAPHVSVGRFAPERTLSFFSFSKAYGMAGNRVGYLVGPPPIVGQALKIAMHSAYHAPTAGQHAALRALEGAGAWIDSARASYCAAGRDAARVLGVPAPEGSMFLFVDVSERVLAHGMERLLEECFDDGVLVAPGASSGAEYAGYIRLCYASMSPEQVAVAVRMLARRLGRASGST